jgi:hypothetical protein
VEVRDLFRDLGFSYIQVIAALFALKVLHPSQVFLIRGNHEFSEQNGKVDNKHSFIRQCYSIYNEAGPCLLFCLVFCLFVCLFVFFFAMHPIHIYLFLIY